MPFAEKHASKIHFQNFVSIIGVAIGVWALIVVLSVMGGFERDLRTKIIENSPHIIIKTEVQEKNLEELNKLPEKLKAIPEIKWIQPYIQDEIMISSPSNMSVNLTLKGIETGSPFSKEILEGQIKDGGLRLLKNPELLVPDRSLGLWDGDEKKIEDQNQEDAKDAEVKYMPAGKTGIRVFPTILLGEELAYSLQVSVGEEIQLILPEGEASPLGVRPKSKTFRVGGIFNTGMYEYDLKLAYIRFDEAMKFFNYGDLPNSMEIRLNDVSDTEKVTGIIKDAILKISPASEDAFEIVTWRDQNRSLFSALKLEKIVMFIILGFIILVAAFNIVGSLMMIILEKTKEISILMSIGATKRGILKIFLFLGFSIGLIGTVTGIFLGIMSCIFIEKVGIQLPKEYYIRTLPVDMRALELVIIGASALVLSLIGTMYPAKIASRFNPVMGLRNE
jgi:lipoprotein-releasing system permease protein